jgi:hypothetical protein
MSLRAPDGAGIKGGKTEYHVKRMLTGIAILHDFMFDKDGVFIESLVYYHARLAARSALNGLYNGRRPTFVRPLED